MLGVRDQVEHFGQVHRARGVGRRLGLPGGVRRLADGDAATVHAAGRAGLVCHPEGCGLGGPRGQRLGLDPVPVLQIACGDCGVAHDDGVVGLAAQPGAGPVRAAGQHRLRFPRRVAVDDELVVPDVAASQHPIGDVHAGSMQRGPRIRIGLVAGTVAGIGQHHRHVLRIAQRGHQLWVGELVQRAEAVPTFGFRLAEQRGDALEYLTCESEPHRIARCRKVLAELQDDRVIRIVEVRRWRPRSAKARQQSGQMLGGQNAAVEIHADVIRSVGRQRDDVGGQHRGATTQRT